MSPDRQRAEKIDTEGCRVEIRRVDGPEARELYFHCQPRLETSSAAAQADALYRAIARLLKAEGAGLESIVSETVFLRDWQANLSPIRIARGRVVDELARSNDRPSITEIEQPPLDERAVLEVSIQAILPKRAPLRLESVGTRTSCDCEECAVDHGLLVQLGSEERFYAGSLYGAGAGAYEQTLAMFRAAEIGLQHAGMEFRDVQRTWIYLREMERDYAALNRARREFFEARGIDPVPASTGIGGGPVSAEHSLSLGVYAIKGSSAPMRTVMTTPTLNEAMTYGADFVRGMRVEESNKVALHVSGTASLNEAGESVHLNDFEAQVDRMLLNVATLLEGQGATYEDVVSGVTYVKHASDGARLREKFRAAGFEGFPNAFVVVPVCRPELLCETEVLAVLPKASGTV